MDQESIASNERVVRWGVLSTADVARKNIAAIGCSFNSRLVALASRQIEKARNFLKENGLAVKGESDDDTKAVAAYGSYDALLQDENVDAVYIPLPTTLHREWVEKAAAKGKHVLVEKPVAVNYEDAVAMVEACKQHSVQFMDGVMLMHHSRTKEIQQLLEKGELGKVVKVVSGFSFMGSKDFFENNIRVSIDADPLGCLGDIGWYCIRGILLARSFTCPVCVGGRLHWQNKDGVPLHLSAWMEFEDGAVGHFDCSFNAPFRNWLEIVGTKRIIRVNDFVLNVSDESAKWWSEKSSSTFPNQDTLDMHETNSPCCQQVEMFSTFSDLVIGKQLDDKWPKMTLLTQKVLNAIHESIKEGGKPITITSGN